MRNNERFFDRTDVREFLKGVRTASVIPTEGVYWLDELRTLAQPFLTGAAIDGIAGLLHLARELDADDSFAPKTKVLLFCSPSNPTGSVYSTEQVKAIGQWAVKHGIWVITDEIYEHLLYDGATAPSLPVLVPELADTCIIINGVAKTYAMTGWRVGWMIGPKDVIKAATNLQSHLTSNVANVSQRAAIAALNGNLDAVHKMGEAFDRRRKLIVGLLNEIPGFKCPTPTGAFYVYPSVKGVLGTTIRGKTPKTSAELATLILEEAEVAAVPGEAFGPSGYLRFSYATSDEDIIEGIGRIKKLITQG